MVIVDYNIHFRNMVNKIKDNLFKIKVKKQIIKIKENPEIGKPLRNLRKGTREVYLKPFRLSYVYFKEEDKIIFLDLYHKDK